MIADGVGQVVVGLRVVRLERDGLAIKRNRFFHSAETDKHITHHRVGGSRLRLCMQNLHAEVQRLIETSGVHQSLGELEPCVWILRVDLQCGAKLGYSAGLITTLGEGLRKVGMGQGQMRGQSNRGAKHLNRLGKPPLLNEDRAEIRIGFAGGGVEFEHVRVLTQGVVESALVLGGGGDLQEGFRIVGQHGGGQGRESVGFGVLARPA